MEALEQKVQDLEAKVARLEGSSDSTVDSKDITYGDVVPKSFSSSNDPDLSNRAKSTPRRKDTEGWVRSEQDFINADRENADMNPKRDVNNKGTEWVRKKQTFYDTNY